MRLLVWFGAAVIGHDLIAFPLYTGLDRLLIRAIAGSPRPTPQRPSLAGGGRRSTTSASRCCSARLLLLMWYPLIFKRSDGVYFAASGQHQSRYLGNCLLAVALLFGGSLLIFLLRLARAAGRSRTGASPPRTSPTPPS